MRNRLTEEGAGLSLLLLSFGGLLPAGRRDPCHHHWEDVGPEDRALEVRWGEDFGWKARRCEDHEHLPRSVCRPERGNLGEWIAAESDFRAGLSDSQ